MVSQRWRVLLSSAHTFSFLPSTSLFQFSVSADKLWLTFLFLGEHLEEFTGNSIQTWSSQIAWRHAGDALDDQNVKNDERLCFKLIERKMRKNAMKCKMKFSKFYLDAIICCCGGCRGNSAFKRQKKPNGFQSNWCRSEWMCWFNPLREMFVSGCNLSSVQLLMQWS